jgi:hypothetical protein
MRQRKLESIFEMGGGYSLDFSNSSFADFVKTAIGLDPYMKYDGGSKAVLLRKIWQTEPPASGCEAEPGFARALARREAHRRHHTDAIRT